MREGYEKLPGGVRATARGMYDKMLELLEKEYEESLEFLVKLKKEEDFRFFQGRAELLGNMLKWWRDGK